MHAAQGHGSQPTAGREEAARAAIEQAVQQAEGLLDAIMAGVPDRRDKDAVAQAIEAYIARYGEPRFRIQCYCCEQTLADWPLVYPTARARLTWMPPSYYVARFNHDAQQRLCPSCGTQFPPVP